MTRHAMTGPQPLGSRPLGPLIHSFFLDHLVTVKGLRPASVRSYRDTIRLLLCYIAKDKGSKITKLAIADLSFERVLGFLRYLEDERGNHVRTRNQRLAALHTLFDYIANREPEMLGICQRVAAIPMKRAAPAAPHFLERDEMAQLFRRLPHDGRLALRDRALLLLLYNTGARVQEVADLRAGHLDLTDTAVVRLHGKGDKWRTCPLWQQTATLLAQLLHSPNTPSEPDTPVFRSTTGQALTRFGIYKIVRRHTGQFDDARTERTVSPHTFRHTAAVHLLEAGVEVNVIRGWLGHADLTTTNRYAEINTRAKIEALRNTEPPGASEGSHTRPVWRSDEALLRWLSSL
jgi:integrase/recombinase XerD